MRDEDDGSALLEVFDDSEQKIDFLLLQHRGRLVEENRHITFDSAIERQRFGDLDHLPIGKGKVCAAPAWMHLEMDLAQFVRRGSVHARFRDQPISWKFFLAPRK